MKRCANCNLEIDDNEACCPECGWTVFQNLDHHSRDRGSSRIIANEENGEIPVDERRRHCLMIWIVCLAAMVIIAGRWFWAFAFITLPGIPAFFFAPPLEGDLDPRVVFGSIVGWLYYIVLTLACLRVRRRVVFEWVFAVLCISFVVSAVVFSIIWAHQVRVRNFEYGLWTLVVAFPANL
jgi:hypothetical protein